MKRLTLIIAGLACAAAIPAVQASEELAKSSGCLACHNVSGKKMGPGFKEVAAKYKDDAKAEEKITAMLEGKGEKKHPATKASDADKAALAKWVMSLK
jgi:cytochrome c